MSKDDDRKRKLREMMMDDDLVARLGEAYAREGRAEDAGAGQERVREEIAEVIAVFDAADLHLDAIDATVARIDIEHKQFGGESYSDIAIRRAGNGEGALGVVFSFRPV